MHDDYDDEQAYADDLAAQNAVEDAKYDFPPQEEPPEGYYDQPPTHHELAEDLLQASDLAKNDAWAQIRATQAVARAVLALAERIEPSASRELVPLTANDVAARWPLFGSMTGSVAVPTLDAVRIGSISPTDPAELGDWLRALPWRTILRDQSGDPCLRETGTEHGHQSVRRFPAIFILGDAFEISEDHENNVEDLARYAPFTVLALGEVEPSHEGGD